MEFDELINKINQEIENDCKQIISKVDTYKQKKTSINENLSGNAFESSRIMYRVVTVDFINPFAYLPT